MLIAHPMMIHRRSSHTGLTPVCGAARAAREVLVAPWGATTQMLLIHSELSHSPTRRAR